MNRNSLTVNQENNVANRNNISANEKDDEPPSKFFFSNYFRLSFGERWLDKMCTFSIGKKHAPNYGNDENAKSGKCESCGNNLDENNVKLRKDKRFCSTICAKRFVAFLP